ncbi:hypothetical protein [Nocardioides limicola]|uniref:hypothetical protein n=1 Tax=Nocardioides limicola TaxID=2803368 RepID=UPI00193BC74C|nr:hypothetical protein [Nocardioides sp. DJM-14]
MRTNGREPPVSSAQRPVRRRLTYANVVSTLALFAALTGGGVATASHLTVRTNDIVKGAVTTPKLAGGAVKSGKIAGGAVTSGKLAGGAVTSGKLAGGAVTSGKLANKAVTAAKRAATPQVKVGYAPQNPGVTVPHHTGTLVPFNVEQFDTGDMWTASQGNRITIRTSGTYLAIGSGVWQSGQDGGTERNLCVMVWTASNAIKDAACQRVVPTTSWTQSQHIPLLIQLNAGDYLNLEAWQNSGDNANLLSPQLAVVWLGPAS